MKQKDLTHQQFIHAVRDIVVKHCPDAEVREKLMKVTLLYGCGDGSYRGICHYESWTNGHGTVDTCEIAATGEESPVQLAGTTIHELAHTLTRSGHDKLWKTACKYLGLQAAKVGQAYFLANLTPGALGHGRGQKVGVREDVAELLKLADGSPAFKRGLANPFGSLLANVLRPCPMGIGTRGGKSRGKGSGSRLVLYTLDHDCVNPADGRPEPKRMRIAHPNAHNECYYCHRVWKREEEVTKAEAKVLQAAINESPSPEEIESERMYREAMVGMVGGAGV